MQLRRLILGLVVLALVAPIATAEARSGGMSTDEFPNPPLGCNGCHSTGLTPTVTLLGPTSVDTNTTNEYTLIINSIGSQVFGGLNASSPTGLLRVGGADSLFTKVKVGTGGRDEITHTQRKSEVAGEIRFSFEWKAPNSAGPASIAGWGNAVNGSTTLGDKAALATLVITVNQGPPVAVPASGAEAGLALTLLLLASAIWVLRRRSVLAR